MPPGTTPKDGSSTSVTLYTAPSSLFTGKTVDPNLAMTGRITSVPTTPELSSSR